MTQDSPDSPAYDPTWRPFAGAMRFTPHPSSLQGDGELARSTAYRPAYAPAPAPAPPSPLPSPEDRAAALPAPDDAEDTVPAVAPAWPAPSASPPAPTPTPPSPGELPKMPSLFAAFARHARPEPAQAAEWPAPASIAPIPIAEPTPESPLPEIVAPLPTPHHVPPIVATWPAPPPPPPPPAPSAAPSPAPPPAAAGAAKHPAPPPKADPEWEPPEANQDDTPPPPPLRPGPDTPAKLVSLYGTEAAAAPRIARRKRRWPVAVATLLVAASLAAAVAVYLRGRLPASSAIVAVFNAPMLVLRAVGAGDVTSVPVKIGQAVDPATVLLTLHVDPLPSTALDSLKDRLAKARDRQASLDQPGADPAKLPRQKDAVGAEIEQLQRAIAAGSAAAPDMPVVAGVRGIVWALDARAGGRTDANAPLAQIADCGRAFLTLGDAVGAFKAGATVLIRLPNLRPFRGTVRPSASVAEPPDTLVVEPTGFAAAAPGACPVGSSAEIEADPAR